MDIRGGFSIFFERNYIVMTFYSLTNFEVCFPAFPEKEII